MAGVVPQLPPDAIRTISSRQNPIVRLYRSLARQGDPGSDEPRLLLDGLHLLAEARAAGLTIESAAFAPGVLDAEPGRGLARALSEAGTRVLAVSESVLAAMSPVRTPSGVVAVALRARASIDAVLSRTPQLVVVAAGVQDAGNLGAIMRTAEAAGATGVVACGAGADPFGWKALRGSMGSAFRLPVARDDLDRAISACRSAGLLVLAAVPRGGQSPYDVDLRRPAALILGGEGQGLPERLVAAAHARVSMPMQPPVESLNVAVAAAVFLYEAHRQRAVRGARQQSQE